MQVNSDVMHCTSDKLSCWKHQINADIAKVVQGNGIPYCALEANHYIPAEDNSATQKKSEQATSGPLQKMPMNVACG